MSIVTEKFFKKKKRKSREKKSFLAPYISTIPVYIYVIFSLNKYKFKHMFSFIINVLCEGTVY